MKYKDELIKSMEWLGKKDDVLFLGQACKVSGHSISGTLTKVPEDKRIELPVFEEVQLGLCTGMALEGFVTVSIYPRFDFFILACNQLVNHLDKLEAMSDGEWKPNVIVRVGKGSDKPLDPGHQHKADYTDAFEQMVTNCTIHKLDKVEKIVPAYKQALKEGGIHIIVEYPELYYV